MKTLLAFLLLVSAALAQPTAEETELLGTLDTLDSQVVPLPESPEKDAIEAASSTLRSAVEALPDLPPDPPPTTGDIVVADGATLTLSGTVDADKIHVMAGGTLLLVAPCTVIIADKPLDPADTEQDGRGITIEGTIRAHGTPKVSFVRATTDIAAGATSITLNADPTGWQIGDTLVLPDSRQRIGTAASRSETVTLTGIAGTMITITPALYAHPSGPRPELTPHVANLTRDIVFRSANPDGVRGHILAAHGATVNMTHCEIRDMGRTKKSVPLDPATNHIGRYPLHFHHMGEATGQVTVSGCAIYRSPGWGLAVHATHGCQIEGNVIYDVVGSAYVCEDGSERRNVFDGNMAIRCRHVHLEKDNLDVARSGDGFWAARYGNVWRNNVAADCEWSCYMVNGYAGAGPHVNTYEVAEISGNEGYGSERLVYGTWQQGVGHSDLEQYGRQEYADLLGWNIYQTGVDIYHTNRNTFRRLKLYNDPAATNAMPNHHANPLVRVNSGFVTNTTYQNGGLELIDCEIEGYVYGIQLPMQVQVENWFRMTGGRLANYLNVTAFPSKFFDRDTRIEGVVFAGTGGVNRPSLWDQSPTTIPQTPLDVWMCPLLATLDMRSDVLLIGYSETPLRLWHKEWPTPPCTDERPLILGYVCEE